MSATQANRLHQLNSYKAFSLRSLQMQASETIPE